MSAIVAAGHTLVKAIAPMSLGSCVAYLSMLDTGTRTVTPGAPDTVTSWTNQVSSVAWNTASTYPEYVASAINGNPGIKGNGSSRILRSTEAAVLAAFNGNDHDFTVFAVVKVVTADANGSIFGVGNSALASADVLRFGTSTTGSGRWISNRTDSTSAGAATTSDADIDTNPHVMAFTCASGQLDIYQDFTKVGTGSPLDLASFTCDQFSLLARPDSVADNFGDMYIGAIAICDAAVTATQRRGVQAYLRSAWSITTS